MIFSLNVKAGHIFTRFLTTEDYLLLKLVSKRMYHIKNQVGLKT